MENKYLCRYCSANYSSDRATRYHENFCKSNPEKKNAWNFGKTAKTCDDLAKLGKSISKSKTGVSRNGWKPWNHGLIGASGLTGKAKTAAAEIERCRKLSEWAIVSGNGGYKPGSGRGKKGWYRGFFCDSSWELAYVIYCLDHNIDIQRNTERRKYEFDGKIRNYIPDFIVNGVLTEIKGYKTEQWMAKLSANPDVTVLYEKDLKSILQYVRLKYGNDYINNYE